MQQIADWLDKLGLSEYAQRFADNAIDLSVIRDLTEQDLKDLGVPLGHRPNKLGGEHAEAVELTLCVSMLDADVSSLHPSQLPQAFPECIYLS